MKCKFLTFALPPGKIIMLLIVINLIGSISLFGQKNAAIDSLLSIIAESPEDTGKVIALVHLGNEYMQDNDPVQSGKFMNEAQLLAAKLNFKAGMVQIQNMLGSFESKQNHDSLAMAHYKNALQVANGIQRKDLIARVNYNIGLQYEKQGDYLQSTHHQMEARKFFESIQDEDGIAKANLEIGGNYRSLGDYKEAIRYYELALKGREKLKDKLGMAEMKRNIGNMHGFLGNNIEALNWQIEALKLNEELGNRRKIAESNNDLGSVYLSQGKLDDALRHFLYANEVFREMGIKQRISLTYNNIGNAYFKKGDFDKAIENHLLSVAIKEEMNDKDGLFFSYYNLSTIYISQGRNAEAMKYLQSATRLSEELGNKTNMGSSYLGLGRLAIALDSLEEARTYLFKALNLFRETGTKPAIQFVYKHLARLDSIKGDFKQSLEYYKLYTAHRDSIFNENNNKAFDELQTKYETEKKDKEIQTLESRQAINDLQLKIQRESINRIESENALHRQQLILFENESKLQQLELEKNQLDITLQKTETQRQQDQVVLLNKEGEIKSMKLKRQTLLKNYLLIGIGCAMLVGFFVYRNHMTKQKLKLQVLRNKIANDLHDDVGSTLSSISIFSEMAQAQSKEVIPLLKTINESSRKMLEAMADIVWTINPENDQFEKIIMRMRNFAFELLGAKQIDFEFNADEEINKLRLPMDVRKNLYLIFKEATNNMVKYSEASEAEFLIKNNQDKVVMMIRDNGKGFDPNRATEGNGIKSMRKRAEEMGADFILKSLPGQGTLIELKIAV